MLSAEAGGVRRPSTKKSHLPLCHCAVCTTVKSQPETCATRRYEKEWEVLHYMYNTTPVFLLARDIVKLGIRIFLTSQHNHQFAHGKKEHSPLFLLIPGNKSSFQRFKALSGCCSVRFPVLVGRPAKCYELTKKQGLYCTLSHG